MICFICRWFYKNKGLYMSPFSLDVEPPNASSPIQPSLMAWHGMSSSETWRLRHKHAVAVVVVDAVLLDQLGQALGLLSVIDGVGIRDLVAHTA